MRLECFTTGQVFGELVPARQDRAWMDAFPDRHAYRCLPLGIANSFGWQVLCPCTVDIAYNGGTSSADLTVSSPDAPDLLEHVAKSNFSRGIVTFHTGYLFRTDADTQLLATGPLNEPKDGLYPLTGVIETNWLPYPFTMNWQLTRAGSFRFEKGEPICHIFPLPIGQLDELVPEIRRIEDDPGLKAEHEAFRDKRTEFMKRFRAGDPATIKEAWQKFYFRGRLPTGGKAPETHVHKLRLAAPVDRRGTPSPLALPVPKTPAAIAVAEKAPEMQAKPRMLRVVGRQADTDAILYHEGLLRPEHCRHLVQTFERRHNLTAATPDGFFASRVIWMTRLPEDEESEALRIMQQARFVAAHHVGRFFGHARPLFDDAPQLVKWPTGYAMPPHADNEHPDGSAHETPHRLYAGVVFLNDDFEGGVLYLDRAGIAIKPKPGLLVGFRGDASHRHGVSKITSGERYTMPMWFTDDLSKAAANIGRVY